MKDSPDCLQLIAELKRIPVPIGPGNARAWASICISKLTALLGVTISQLLFPPLSGTFKALFAFGNYIKY
jgi:hypothetical protein